MSLEINIKNYDEVRHQSTYKNRTGFSELLLLIVTAGFLIRMGVMG